MKVLTLLASPFLALAFQGVIGELKREAPTPAVRGAVPRFVELMKAGIETKEPNVGIPNTARLDTVFDGSFDYHSCLSAHWALCVIARVEGDKELEEWIAARLTTEVLAKEHAELMGLAKNPWTFPYEHAWMAMLLSELDRLDALDPGVVYGFRVDVETKLFEGLEQGDLPENIPPASSGGTGFNGFYKSWLLAFWLLQMSEPVSDGAAERLERLRVEKLEPKRAAIASHDKVFGFDFLHVPALLALIDRTAPGGAKVPATSPYDPGQLPDLPEKVTIGTVHVLGIEACRVWPSAIDAHAGDEEARVVLNTQLDRILARGDLWSDDFMVVSHWMPQFLYMAIWLAEGRP